MMTKKIICWHINSVHDGKKDHKCTSKTFSDTGNLKAHINSIHDGQKEENDVHGRYDDGKND